MSNLINRNAAKEQFNDIPPFIGMTGGCVQQMLDSVPAADAVEIKTLEAWLYEIAMNNSQNSLGFSCEEIISRLDGLRTYAKEKAEEAAKCDGCGERSPATGWCKEKGIYTEPGGTCQNGGAG